jgi:hypothetical protein
MWLCRSFSSALALVEEAGFIPDDLRIGENRWDHICQAVEHGHGEDDLPYIPAPEQHSHGISAKKIFISCKHTED